jgi:protein transport protein YIF1
MPQFQHAPSTLPVTESPTRSAVSPMLPASVQSSVPPFPSLGSYASQTAKQSHEQTLCDAQDLSATPFSRNHEQVHQHPQQLGFQPLPQHNYEQVQQSASQQPHHQPMPNPVHHFSMFQQHPQQNFERPPAQYHEQAPQATHGVQQSQQDYSFMGLNMNGALNGAVPYGMGAVPGMPMLLAGMAHQLVSQGTGGANDTSSIAPHLMQNLGVSQYFSSPLQDSANTFMRLPKYYFEVNHSYVLKKLLLLLIPFTRRSWSRKRAVEQVHFDNNVSDTAQTFMPPRDDVNAPDLYIPVMSFVTYFLLVGFIFGTQNAFAAEVLARYCSKGLGVLTLEVLIIKLGLYLINAQPTPWLDVVSYRGYKFVGVIVAMVANVINPKLYYASFGYAAVAMFIFLLRSHRRIILPRELDQRFPADVAQRNAFLLFICALQFPIYWILILDVRSIVAN